MPCHKCRPMFIKMKKRWSLKAFQNLREKYTEQYLRITELEKRCRELEENVRYFDDESAQRLTRIMVLEAQLKERESTDTIITCLCGQEIEIRGDVSLPPAKETSE